MANKNQKPNNSQKKSQTRSAIIFANGENPFSYNKSKSEKEFIKNMISEIKNADLIFACDGALIYLDKNHISPDFIVGDLDSISKNIVGEKLEKKYSQKLIRFTNQENNDLTKTVEYAISKGVGKITIFGATGKREDHTIANISLLAQYTQKLEEVVIKSIWSTIFAVGKEKTFQVKKGVQVSIFALDKNVKITTYGLDWKLENAQLKSWWMGSLNQTSSDEFTIKTNSNTPKVIVWIQNS
ncbi:MAG: thiamine diphosphokinase [Bifidobacteriaceae bacterium]|jgi:thiamine pyrophosphokinase|nr:thiamine diphosphokinase [Bifidobacteriaceae bacterium]